MRFIFKEDGTLLLLRKIPYKNIIEAKLAGKKILYERTEDGLKKLNEEADHREGKIVNLIRQYYLPGRTNKNK